MGAIIIPGAHGIGTQSITETAYGYERAADQLVGLYNENRAVDTSDYNVRRVMDYFGASSMEELRTKRRGW